MLIRLHSKLEAKYYGPFQVAKQVGPVAFRACIHHVFHVSQFKIAVRAQLVEKELPEDL